MSEVSTSDQVGADRVATIAEELSDKPTKSSGGKSKRTAIKASRTLPALVKVESLELTESDKLVIPDSGSVAEYQALAIEAYKMYRKGEAQYEAFEAIESNTAEAAFVAGVALNKLKPIKGSKAEEMKGESFGEFLKRAGIGRQWSRDVRHFAANFTRERAIELGYRGMLREIAFINQAASREAYKAGCKAERLEANAKKRAEAKVAGSESRAKHGRGYAAPEPRSEGITKLRDEQAKNLAETVAAHHTDDDVDEVEVFDISSLADEIWDSVCSIKTNADFMAEELAWITDNVGKVKNVNDQRMRTALAVLKDVAKEITGAIEAVKNFEDGSIIGNCISKLAMVMAPQTTKGEK